MRFALGRANLAGNRRIRIVRVFGQDGPDNPCLITIFNILLCNYDVSVLTWLKNNWPLANCPLQGQTLRILNSEISRSQNQLNHWVQNISIWC